MNVKVKHWINSADLFITLPSLNNLSIIDVLSNGILRYNLLFYLHFYRNFIKSLHSVRLVRWILFFKLSHRYQVCLTCQSRWASWWATCHWGRGRWALAAGWIQLAAAGSGCCWSLRSAAPAASWYPQGYRECLQNKQQFSVMLIIKQLHTNINTEWPVCIVRYPAVFQVKIAMLVLWK